MVNEIGEYSPLECIEKDAPSSDHTCCVVYLMYVCVQ